MTRLGFMERALPEKATSTPAHPNRRGRAQHKFPAKARAVLTMACPAPVVGLLNRKYSSSRPAKNKITPMASRQIPRSSGAGWADCLPLGVVFLLFF